MKKLMFLLIVALFASFALMAQDSDYKAPDYDAIKQIMTEDPNLYSSLEDRFLRADTSLKNEDIRILYYGKVFRKDYSPYEEYEWTDNMKKIMHSEHVKPSILKQELKNINKAILKYPLSMDCHAIKYVICGELFGDESDELMNAAINLSMLMGVILSTGDGQSKESAIHVITVSDEHTLMQLVGIGWNKQSLIEDNGQYYDFFDVAENYTVGNENITVGDAEKLYFNITPCFKTLISEPEQSTSSESEYSNSIEIPLGTRVTLRLKEGENGTFQVAVIDRQPYSGEEVTDSTFSSENDPDIVELIFAQEKSSYSDHDWVYLSAKSFYPKALSFDSFIMSSRKAKFESTSNVGWYTKAFMREQWFPGVAKIRIENIRIMEL